MTNIVSNPEKTKDFFKNLCMISLWYPIGLVALYVHYGYLDQHVFLFAAQMSAEGAASSAELSFFDKVPYLARTMLDYFIILPVLTWGILHFIDHWLTRVCIFIVALAVLWINFNNMISFATTGHFISLTLLIDAFYWGKQHPEIIEEYADRTALAAFLGFVAILAFCYFIQHVKCPQKQDKIGFCFRLPAITLILSSFVIFLLSSIAPPSLYGSSTGFLIQQVASFFDKEYAEADELELPEDLQEITQAFKKETNSLKSISSEDFSGREKDSNVIFIVMETGPNKGFMDEKYPELFPNFNALKTKSFYSDLHLSSYLYTSDAMFSIFGSIYTDIKTRKEFLNDRKDKTTIAGLGIFDHLNRAGYDTGIYSPALPIVIDDEVMYQMLGVKHQYYAESEMDKISFIRSNLDRYLKVLTDVTSYDEKTRGKLDLQVPPDVVTLNKMLSDIEKNVKKGQKFGAVFLPQVGHGPWPDVSNSGRSDDMNNAKLLMSLQDHWVGKITDKLKELGIFENTIIVITSDHGLRTITEYSDMNPNAVNEASYWVPFLLYAPNSLTQGAELTHHTSHIDVMPTVLSLLGLSPQKSCMLGANIWQDDLPNRRLYLLGRRYTGVDGYVQGGKYYSYHAVQKFAFKSDDFSFGKKNFLRKEQKEYLEVQSNINFQHGVQQNILSKLLTEDCAF